MCVCVCVCVCVEVGTRRETSGAASGVCECERVSQQESRMAAAWVRGDNRGAGGELGPGRFNPTTVFLRIVMPSSRCVTHVVFSGAFRRQVYHIEAAHGQLVRDLDFNPNRQYHLASCGDDCKAKFWDVRKATEPVKVLSDHSHW